MFKCVSSLLLSATLLGLSFSSPSQGAIIAMQEFNGVPNASTGFTGNALDSGTSMPGLVYSTLVVNGTSRDSSSPQVGFSAGALPQTSQYFLSFLLDNKGNLNDRLGLTLFASFATNGNGPGGGTEVVEFGQQSGKIGYLDGNYAPAPVFGIVSSATNAATGAHLFVIGVDTNQTTNVANLSFYYDPTTSTPPSPILTLSTPSFNLEQIRAFGGSGRWDEFRVGNTFADVTPGLFAGVPEPSVRLFLLFGLAMGGMFFRRRA